MSNSENGLYVSPVNDCKSHFRDRRIPSFNELIETCSIPSTDAIRHYPLQTVCHNHALEQYTQRYPLQYHNVSSPQYTYQQSPRWSLNYNPMLLLQSYVPATPTFTDKTPNGANKHPKSHLNQSENAFWEKKEPGEEPKPRIHHQIATELLPKKNTVPFKQAKSKSDNGTNERSRKRKELKSTSKHRKKAFLPLNYKNKPRPYRRNRYLNKELCIRNNTKCLQCGSIESPEWRTGPGGSRTLCNACGLLFAKLSKKMGWEAAEEALANHRESVNSPDRKIGKR